MKHVVVVEEDTQVSETHINVLIKALELSEVKAQRLLERIPGVVTKAIERSEAELIAERFRWAGFRAITRPASGAEIQLEANLEQPQSLDSGLTEPAPVEPAPIEPALTETELPKSSLEARAKEAELEPEAPKLNSGVEQPPEHAAVQQIANTQALEPQVSDEAPKAQEPAPPNAVAVTLTEAKLPAVTQSPASVSPVKRSEQIDKKFVDRPEPAAEAESSARLEPAEPKKIGFGELRRGVSAGKGDAEPKVAEVARVQAAASTVPPTFPTAFEDGSALSEETGFEGGLEPKKPSVKPAQPATPRVFEKSRDSAASDPDAPSPFSQFTNPPEPQATIVAEDFGLLQPRAHSPLWLRRLVLALPAFLSVLVVVVYVRGSLVSGVTEALRWAPAAVTDVLAVSLEEGVAGAPQAAISQALRSRLERLQPSLRSQGVEMVLLTDTRGTFLAGWLGDKMLFRTPVALVNILPQVIRDTRNAAEPPDLSIPAARLNDSEVPLRLDSRLLNLGSTQAVLSVATPDDAVTLIGQITRSSLLAGLIPVLLTLIASLVFIRKQE